MDPLDRIDEIIAMVEDARSVPMSRTNCHVRPRLRWSRCWTSCAPSCPATCAGPAALLEERDKIIDAGKREADRIIGEGETEHARLVSVNEITVSRRARGRPDHRRGPGRGAAAARGGRRLRRHRAGQLRAVPDPVAGLDRAWPRQDARAARDRHLRDDRGWTTGRCRSDARISAVLAGGGAPGICCRPGAAAICAPGCPLPPGTSGSDQVRQQVQDLVQAGSPERPECSRSCT